MRPTQPGRPLLLVVVAALVAAACGPSSPSASASPSAAAFAPYGSYAPAARPSTTAKVTIVSPTPNEVITGNTVHVVVNVTGATIVDDTNEDIRPDQGHVHVYLDNALWYMQYSLTKDIPVNPGTYTIKAEFVANDHFPFNPRDWSDQVFFTVK
jgi:ABC-type Fe3+-hydroxamate transport system substrate-binding protein